MLGKLWYFTSNLRRFPMEVRRLRVRRGWCEVISCIFPIISLGSDLPRNQREGREHPILSIAPYSFFGVEKLRMMELFCCMAILRNRPCRRMPIQRATHAHPHRPLDLHALLPSGLVNRGCLSDSHPRYRIPTSILMIWFCVSEGVKGADASSATNGVFRRGMGGLPSY